jgi:rod shape-determining protein MreD
VRTTAHILGALVFLAITGAVWRATPFEIVFPDVGLVFALYFGVTARGKAVEAVAGAMVIGYLADVLAGAPRGLHALIFGAVALLARLASTRLLLRGSLVIATFTFFWAVAAGLAVVTLRNAYGQAGPWEREVLAAVGSAVCTAILAPLVFRFCRRLDGRFARTSREREAAREGWI